MKTVSINTHLLKMYDSVDEMPIVNFQKFNKLLLLDSGIGSTVDDVDTHLSHLASLIKSDIDKAQIEIQNLRQNLAMIVLNISPKFMAFVPLVAEIDGKPLTDLSDENCIETLKLLNTKVSSSFITTIIENVKKKFKPN